MGVRVHVGDHEHLDNAIKRFKELVHRDRKTWKWWTANWQFRGGTFRAKPADVRRFRKYVRHARAGWAEWWRARGLDPPARSTGRKPVTR